MRVARLTLAEGKPVSVIAEQITHWYGADPQEEQIRNCRAVVATQSGAELRVRETPEKVELALRRAGEMFA